MLHFDQQPANRQQDRFEIAGAAYRLRQSACFEKSNGALHCTTCHDPHQPASVREYTGVCRQCHGAAFDGLVAAGQHPASTDCTSCHMPKRRTDDVVHVAMTDHFLQRRKPARDLLAPIAERPPDAKPYRGDVVLYYPKALPKAENELYLAIAQVLQGSNRSAGIGQLSAALEKYHPERADYYVELANALRESGQIEKAVPVYEEALRRRPRDLPALQNLAVSFLSTGQPRRAAALLERAVEGALDDGATWQLLGTAYFETGRTADAIAAFQKAIAADPDLAEAHNSLGAVWFRRGDFTRAEPELREAIRLQTIYPDAHNNLANLLSATDRFAEARYHFEAALRSRTDNAAVRYDYAIALARVRRLNEAEQQLETVLGQNPNFAEAHELQGTVLAARGRVLSAIAQYREALRLRPDFARAQLHLGDAQAALPYLQEAAGASDAGIREEARAQIDKLKN